MAELRDNMLLGLGNPLLDMQVEVKKDFLEKYGLDENNAILAEAKHIPIFEEIASRDDCQFIPGGAAQNALRVAQWVLKRPNVMSFMGCVGKDKFGETLRQKATEAGVNVRYQVDPSTETGTCAVLIYNEHRSLCANLAAANKFTVDHIEKEENWNYVTGADYYYIGGFFLTVCPPAIQKVAEHAASTNKLFAMNLSAPFLVEFFADPMMAALPFVDLLFGNETEFTTFAKKHNLETEDLKEIALKVSGWEKKNTKRKRMVVITQGSNATIVAHDGKVCEYPIIAISPDKLVDTNGAGDAFAGGFLSQLIQGKTTEECIRCGNFAGNVIIQRSGCTTPSTCDFK